MESFAFPDDIKIQLTKLPWSQKIHTKISLKNNFQRHIFTPNSVKAAYFLNHPKHQTLHHVLMKLGGQST